MAEPKGLSDRLGWTRDWRACGGESRYELDRIVGRGSYGHVAATPRSEQWKVAAQSATRREGRRRRDHPEGGTTPPRPTHAQAATRTSDGRDVAIKRVTGAFDSRRDALCVPARAEIRARLVLRQEDAARVPTPQKRAETARPRSRRPQVLREIRILSALPAHENLVELLDARTPLPADAREAIKYLPG